MPEADLKMGSGSAGRILFIGLDYHKYTRAICAEFAEAGYDCRFHSIQPGRIDLKILRRLGASPYQRALDSYHRGIIGLYPDDFFSHVVFLQVHQMSQEVMADLKAKQTSARYILYNWDAVTTHDYRPYLRHFDRAFTFDIQDAETLGITYLPLFCIRDFQSLLRDRADPLSIYFVGNIVNPQRYVAVTGFADYAHAHGMRFDCFLSTTVHGWTKMIRNGLRPQNVTLRSIDQDRFVAMMSGSAAVFDFANHSQSGFTMRTIENLCAGKKIITNNARVHDMAFYSPDRFLIFDGMDFSGVRDFMDIPLADPAACFPEYHIQSFVRRLVGEAG